MLNLLPIQINNYPVAICQLETASHNYIAIVNTLVRRGLNTISAPALDTEASGPVLTTPRHLAGTGVCIL